MAKKVIGVLILLLVLVVGVFFVVLYSGIYNVSALKPDSALTAWVFGTAMDKSVQHHARGITVPTLTAPAMITRGFTHYNEMCVSCHGAPGVEPGDIGQGLRPDAPDLKDAAKDFSPAELFWITKNGVRMTGMPAWGVTHSDQEIWNIVAFMQKLPEMTPAEYTAMARPTSILPGGRMNTGGSMKK
ncbi:MAG TPA: cytochrome c [Armatimonadota bacterium]|jgi:mono/diheme cytochrome c family protein